jgi:hypothetical protein
MYGDRESCKSGYAVTADCLRHIRHCTPLFVPQKMLLMPFPHLYETNKSAELGALSVATFPYAVKLCGKCSKTTRNNKAY